MAQEDLLIQIRADNAQLVQKLGEAQSQLRKFGDAKSAPDSVSKSFFSMKGAVLAGTLAIAGTIASLGALAETGSQVKKIDTAFQSLAVSSNTTGNALLSTLKKTSAGAMADVDIMKSSSQAMKLLGEDAIKVLPQMMEIAMSASNATGESVQQSFNDVILAAGRQSVMILDNIGVSAVTANQQIDKFAAGLGKTADKLTDAEKKQAFLNAVMVAGNELVQKQGANLQAQVSGWEKFNTATTNAKNTLATQLNPALDTLFTKLSGAVEKWVALNSVGSKPWIEDQFNQAGENINELTDKIETLKKKWEASPVDSVDKQLFFKQRLEAEEALKEAEKRQHRLEVLLKKDLPTPKVPKPDTSAFSKAVGEIKKDTSLSDYLDSVYGNAFEKEKESFFNAMNYIKSFYSVAERDHEKYLQKKAELEEIHNGKVAIARADDAAKQRQFSEDSLTAQMGFKSQEYAATSQMLGNLETLMQAKDKRLFKIGKLASLGRAGMNISEGMTKALSYGPILGPALATTVAFAGAVQIANIKKQEYGGGSSSVSTPSASSEPETKQRDGAGVNFSNRVYAFATGTHNVPSDMLALIHKNEAIIPATFNQAIQRGDMTLGGPSGASGTTNIIVQGSVIHEKDLAGIVDNYRSQSARNSGRQNYASRNVYRT